MNANRLAVILMVCFSIPALGAELTFHIDPSELPGRTLEGGVYDYTSPPSPADLILTISVKGARARVAIAIAKIDVDTKTLPSGVIWTGRTGYPTDADTYLLKISFHVARSRPFRLRRQHFHDLPDWLKLPKLILKRGAPKWTSPVYRIPTKA